MGSVVDYIDCPVCNSTASEDFNYRTSETFTSCLECGYHRSVQIKQESRKKSLADLTEDDYVLTEIKEPFGSFQIKMYDAIGTYCGTILNLEHLEEIKKKVLLKEDIEYVNISQFLDGQIVKQTIIDNGPKVDSAGFTAEDR